MVITKTLFLASKVSDLLSSVFSISVKFSYPNNIPKNNLEALDPMLNHLQESE